MTELVKGQARLSARLRPNVRIVGRVAGQRDILLSEFGVATVGYCWILGRAKRSRLKLVVILSRHRFDMSHGTGTLNRLICVAAIDTGLASGITIPPRSGMVRSRGFRVEKP